MEDEERLKEGLGQSSLSMPISFKHDSQILLKKLLDYRSEIIRMYPLTKEGKLPENTPPATLNLFNTIEYHIRITTKKIGEL